MSSDNGRSMTGEELAFIGIRLLAVYLVFSYLPWLADMGHFLKDAADGVGVLSAMFTWLVSAGPVLVAAIAWWLAPLLAPKLLPRGAAEARIVPGERARDVAAIVIAVAGLLMIATTLPSLANVATMSALKGEIAAQIDDDGLTARWVAEWLRLGLGLVLLLGAPFFSRLVFAIRDFGLQGKRPQRGS